MMHVDYLSRNHINSVRVCRTGTLKPSTIEEYQKQDVFLNRIVVETAEPEPDVMAAYELNNDISINIFQ